MKGVSFISTDSKRLVGKYKIINRKKRLATQFIDILCSPFYGIKHLIGTKSLDLKSVRKILLIRTAYIGDVVMTLPMLKPLKRACPLSEITILIPKAAEILLDNNPYIDKIITYDAFWFYSQSKFQAWKEYKTIIKYIRKEKFDLVIDARGDIRDIFFLVYRSKSPHRVSYGYGGGDYFLTHIIPYDEYIHKVDAHLKILEYLGIPVLHEDRELKIYLSNKEKENARSMLTRLGIRDNGIVIGIHPGGRKPLKSWSKENYIQLINRLQDETDYQIILTGAPDELKLIHEVKEKLNREVIDISGKTNLRELASFISQMDLFITNDSAPMHLSAAVNTPTIAIFGPSKSIETSPYGEIHSVIENDYPCRWTCDEDKCYYNEYHGCMKSIPIERVYNQVIQKLKSK